MPKEVQDAKYAKLGTKSGRKCDKGSLKIPILGQVENSEGPKVRERSLKMQILGQVETRRGQKCERDHSKSRFWNS